MLSSVSLVMNRYSVLYLTSPETISVKLIIDYLWQKTNEKNYAHTTRKYQQNSEITLRRLKIKIKEEIGNFKM